jgi:hypothetical protein
MRTTSYSSFKRILSGLKIVLVGKQHQATHRKTERAPSSNTAAVSVRIPHSPAASATVNPFQSLFSVTVASLKLTHGSASEPLNAIREE